MASQNEPLLTTTRRSDSLPFRGRPLLATLCTSAIVLSLAAFFHFQPSIHNLSRPRPSDLCVRSPDPASCLAVVSDALVHAEHPTPAAVLDAVILKSQLKLNAASAAAADLNNISQQSALSDCLELFDLSRDHLSAAAAGGPRDARTWLSAVLTNHVTCLEGLGGAARSAMAVHLEDLTAAASASLAVLNALDGGSDDPNPVLDFPSWVPHYDRKLLETSKTAAVLANAVVAQDGTGQYSTVQAAVDASPNNSMSRYVIYVKKGVYGETVRIVSTKTNLMLVGDGMDATVITGSLNNVDGTTTFNSATLAAVGTGLILQDLKIENTAGAAKHQAVALRVGADQSVINRCKLDGYQDTLYAHSLRQFYRDCSISGTVDYIFGNAAVVFQNCTIISRKPLTSQQNTITAQGRTDPNENTGTSIQNCNVVMGADLKPVIGSFPTYLGRPWKLYSRTVFMQSYIEGVDPAGWLAWDGDFALSTLYYGEYMNKGPAAGTAGRVKWPGFKVITDAKTANSFTVAALIQGGMWLTSTGVAFTVGL